MPNQNKWQMQLEQKRHIEANAAQSCQLHFYQNPNCSFKELDMQSNQIKCS